MSVNEALLSPSRLVPWLARAVPELGDGPLVAEQLTGGKSNAVFAVTRGAAAAVLRRPPLTPRPSSNKIMSREVRVLRALEATDVPCPRVLASCEDPAVLGANFYLMSRADGWLGRNPVPPFDGPGPHRAEVAIALVDGLARLAWVDPSAVGLADFGRPEGFLERQVDRWLGELASYRESENYEGRDIPGLGYVVDWLRDNKPATPRISVLHGDYSLANVLFAPDPPARIAAIIDWEQSTLGDPLLDLGWLLYSFNGRHQATPPAGNFDPTDFPTREDLAERYAEVSGVPIDNLRYYLVLAQFKLAAILERHYARALNGRHDREQGLRSGDNVLRLVAKAEAMARGLE